MPDASSEAVWRFAIMFQVGMVLIGLVLVGIGAANGVPLPIVLGILFIALALGGIYFARRSLRELRNK